MHVPQDMRSANAGGGRLAPACFWMAGLLVWALAGAWATVQAAQPGGAVSPGRGYAFDIAAQPLLQALGAFTATTGIAVVRPDERAVAGRAPAVHGRMTADQALERLLRDSEWRFEYRDAQTAVLVARQPAAVYAPDADALSLGAVEVTGTPGDWVYEVPRSVEVITREEIDRRPPRHAAEMLEDEAGAYSMVNEQDPGLSVNIRGLQDFGRVNMMIDGARQNFQVSGHQQRNGQMYIDPELLSAVEIDKGPSSGVHGAGAIAGSANFRTIEPDDIILPGKDWGVRARATTGLGEYSNGTDFIGSLAAAYRNDVFDALVAHSQQHFDEYDPGSHGSLGTDRRVGDASRQKRTVVRDSGSTSRSTLAKIGVRPTDNQRIGLSLLDTDVSYDSTSTTVNGFAAGGADLYEKTGSDDVTSRTYTLSYDYTPASRWVDLSSKLYYVTTYLDQRRYAQGSEYVSTDACEQYYASYDPVPEWVNGYCTPAYQARYRTNTWGLELENTSQLIASSRHLLSADYGVEAYTDKTEPEARLADTDTAFEVSPLGGLTTSTPHGKRYAASAFTQLTYTYADTLELAAGLRHDYYKLKGNTGFTANDDGINMPHEYDYDVDRTFNHTAPTVSAALQVTDWLQPYVRWGRSWRMPAITETLITGAHPSDAATQMFPNPYLDPEKSETWEAGVNLKFDRLLTDEDALRVKFAYFDTRVDDFVYMSLQKLTPHQRYSRLSQLAYDNAANEVRFRGTELKIEYDLGFWYAGLNYTNMIGDNKDDLCSSYFYLGNAYDIADAPDANCSVFGSAEYPPPDKINAYTGLRLLDRQLDIGVKMRHAEGFNESLDESDAAGNDYAYPPVWDDYTVWDFYSSYQPNEHLTLGLTVDNVFDRAYLVGYGDPLAVTLGRGRTVQGSVEYRF